ncbi:MAG: Holliday junction resolvase RuvX, partial [Phycisphaerae bacterium]|nr:Holliday junction resolvase RuvX [Phycisphaerae bacterium]
MRLLAVDLGDKRTGLATGDTETGSAFPIETLHIARGVALVQAVADAANEHGADAIVIGLPLNMDDSEGPRAAISRSFGEA